MRVAVVADHVFAARGLAAAVRDALRPTSLTVVLVAGAAVGTAPEAVGVPPAELVLLALGGPGGPSPAALTTVLRRRSPAPRVLVVLPLARLADIERSLAAGAAGAVLTDPPVPGAAAPTTPLRAVLAEGAVDERLAAALARDAGAILAGGPPPVALTRRERDTLLLLAEGCSNRAIAARLQVGEATVKSHVSRVLRKLGASSRTQAVARGRQAGLL